MSRPINESLELLDTSLDNIKTSLNAKLESGGAELIDSLKVSEVSSYIDQIETGGGGSNKFTIELTHEAGEVSDYFTDANCKLRSVDKSLNYEPVKVRQTLDPIGDSDYSHGYSHYTFDIPKDDITKPTTLEFYNADEGDTVDYIVEIIETGFWIEYEPKFKLLKNDTSEHVGYLSEDISNSQNQYKKLPSEYRRHIYEIDNSWDGTIELVDNTDGFQLSLRDLNLITTTFPYLVYDGAARSIVSIN